MKQYFKKEAEAISKTISELDSTTSFKIALLTDIHLSDTFDETIENITEVDKTVNFNCIVGLGDILTGGIPRGISLKLLKEHFEKCQNAIESKIAHFIQGNHDGYRDETFKGQTVDNIIFDDEWYEYTAFTEQYSNLYRETNKPYYYIDYPNFNIRLIFLCGFCYEYNAKEKHYQKYHKFSKDEQLWFEQVALKLPKDYSVMIFSHTEPMGEVISAPWPNTIEQSGGREMIDIIKKNNADLICWCIGHCHGDIILNVEGIQIVSTASQTAYVPQLWSMCGNGYFPERCVNTVTQDAWDSIIVNTQKRTVNFIRFGAGKDRLIKY